MRIWRIAAVVPIVLLGLYAALPASADTVCSVNEAPCSAAHAYAKGTQLTASTSGTTFVFTSVADQVTCESSSVSYELTTNEVKAGSGAAALVSAKSESFSGCSSFFLGACSSFTASQLATGIKWLGDTKSAGNGYAPFAPGGAGRLTYTCGGTTCVYEAMFTERPRTFTGGKYGAVTEHLGEPFKWVSGPGFCPSVMTAKAERVFSAPEAALFWTVG